jgi:hypothetical protein
LVLVKGDRQKGSQVSPTTNIILILEEDEINPTIRKISKKREDQPYQQEESSGQPCNQEAPNLQAP